MKKVLLLLFLFCSISASAQKKYAIAIHGGAGTILKSRMTPEMEEAYRSKLAEAMNAGYGVLEAGGEAKDAVVAAIQVMEDSPLFNAGKGAVFTHEGRNEMDASIMEGKLLNAGAVAGVRHIKSPISAARAVMEDSPHVLLAGAGAEEFASEKGLELVDTSYFFVQRRWDSLKRILKKDSVQLDHDSKSSMLYSVPEDYKFGTVGCVALDQNGNLAAGTSTGGMTNKRWNRIGDSPIIGAGTYANNKTCAVSCTGHGEYFIRAAVAHDVSALMEYKGLSLKEASEWVVNKKLVEMGGDGGLIAIDAEGNVSQPFNTKGMYRGYKKSDGAMKIAIYDSEEE
ncbi:isoaspartyl peptidase/L-asparaginase [Marinilongibacter aquaticus]|uniref:isoaspartyl peptidase/L-asparaginase family protein n=1 Tax=Marinilongibacter aquaticus TaxID=2975157 RepID=UPI0021BD4B8D|nr:isoaspartyl peptidase/L-asparaginase [Marinilongibacter aquaticus]UBM57811.1 isoaspartyl peptidase/L-asparaginase [Marinilongibacter aquaticus]